MLRRKRVSTYLLCETSCLGAFVAQFPYPSLCHEDPKSQRKLRFARALVQSGHEVRNFSYLILASEFILKSKILILKSHIPNQV